MLLNRNLTAAAAATAIALLMAAPADARVLNMHNGGDVTSLDPHKVSGDWENRVVGDIFEGLVTEDVNAEPIPGMAEKFRKAFPERSEPVSLKSFGAAVGASKRKR